MQVVQQLTVPILGLIQQLMRSQHQADVSAVAAEALIMRQAAEVPVQLGALITKVVLV